MDLYKTLVLFALVCTLAAFFVMWAKYEEEKLKTKAERENYQAALKIGNASAGYAQMLEDILDFTEEFDLRVLATEIRRRAEVEKERDALQDFKSEILCPTNGHIWIDGVCRKCGRAKQIEEDS